MKFRYLFTFLFLSVLLTSCSSIEVLSTWKSDDIATMREKNILVIARTNNRSIRLAYENEVMAQLKEQGIQGSASYKIFPMLDPDKKITESEADSLKKLLLDKGFNGVVLTVLKNVEELTKSEVDYQTDYYTGVTFYPRYYRRFYGYYVNPGSYASMDYYYNNPKEVTTYKAYNYVLETVIYNLDNPNEKQLVGVVTSKIKEPDNIEKTTRQYVKKVAKQIQK